MYPQYDNKERRKESFWLLEVDTVNTAKQSLLQNEESFSIDWIVRLFYMEGKSSH
jgi:hypothetical protein